MDDKDEKTTKDTITIYTDGSVFPNPGEGGWGCINIHSSAGRMEKCGYGGEGVTNNQMELAAIENGLKSINESHRGVPIILYTDSQWCMNCITGVYKKIKKNLEKIREIKKFIHDNKMDITWRFVRGHKKDESTKKEASDWNEVCDKLANKGRLFGEDKVEKKYFKNEEESE